MQQDVKNTAQNLGNVQFRQYEWCSWVNGTSSGHIVPNRSKPMLVYNRVQTTTPNKDGITLLYVHPWDFECIRPI